MILLKSRESKIKTESLVERVYRSVYLYTCTPLEKGFFVLSGTNRPTKPIKEKPTPPNVVIDFPKEAEERYYKNKFSWKIYNKQCELSELRNTGH